MGAVCADSTRRTTAIPPHHRARCYVSNGVAAHHIECGFFGPGLRRSGPLSIYRFSGETKQEHPMGRPPIGKVAMTSTERVHRFRAKHRVAAPETKRETKPSAAPTPALEARVAELEAELARERQRRREAAVGKAAKTAGQPPPLPKTLEEAARQWAEKRASPEFKIAALTDKLQHAQARIAKLESENALQDEIAKRDQRIKALTTQVQNLKAERRVTSEHYKDGLATAGGMSFKTQAAIAKALHSDRSLTEAERKEERDTALKLFTAWKADKDKAVRRAARS
jgi:hypothetical protein